jgi:CBS domain-containing protein
VDPAPDGGAGPTGRGDAQEAAMVLKEKNVHRPHVDTARPDETVLAIADRMRQRNVGTVVVVDAERRPVGIVTDRDLVTRVIADRRDPAETTISHVMTKNPTTVTEHGAPRLALVLMKDGGFRRLPVVDADKRLVGVLSLDDVVRTVVADMSRVVGVLDVQTPEVVAAK